MRCQQLRPSSRREHVSASNSHGLVGLVYWGLTPESYQGGEMMMMMKSVIWWRKPEYPEETTDLRQVTDETFHTYDSKITSGLRAK